MKDLQDLCERLATKLLERDFTLQEVINGLQQAKDMLLKAHPGAPASENVRRARRTIHMLLRSAMSRNPEELRDLLGAHIDLTDIGRSLNSVE